MLMIRSSTERWASMTESERRTLGMGTMAVGRELMATGRHIDGAGLGDESFSRVVRRDLTGERVVTDGPFAEAKEHLAGFLVVECDSEAEAIAIAAKLPDAALSGVDVRPVDESFRPV
ncbi:MAG: YciI family protein [Actinomycetota bacterium]|nr:YciI family protein [Actinomycetota bacterium]